MAGDLVMIVTVSIEHANQQNDRITFSVLMAK